MATPRIFTVRQLNELYVAASSLDGYPVVIKDGENQKTIQAPYRFGGKTRWNLTRILTTLKRHHEEFVKARDALIVEISGGKGTIDSDDSEAIGRLNAELTKALEETVTIEGLLTVSVDDLRLDDNPIPQSVLAALSPLITESEQKA